MCLPSCYRAFAFAHTKLFHVFEVGKFSKVNGLQVQIIQYASSLEYNYKTKCSNRNIWTNTKPLKLLFIIADLISMLWPNGRVTRKNYTSASSWFFRYLMISDVVFVRSFAVDLYATVCTLLPINGIKQFLFCFVSSTCTWSLWLI